MLVIDNGDAIRGIAEVASKLDFTVNGYVGTAATQLADGQMASTEGDLYASGANATVVTSITIVNTDSAARTFTLYLKPSGGTSRAISPVSLDLGISHSFYTDGQRMVVMDASGQVLSTWAVDDTAGGTDGETDKPISSNAFYDHTHILTTKGDLLSYTTVLARLGIGTNTHVLTADSGEGAGMKWAAVSAGTLEFFVPATFGTEQAYRGEFSICRINATNDYAVTSFYAPHDFTSITEAVVIFIPNTTATHRVNFLSDYGASGEAYNTNTEADEDNDLSLTQWQLAEFDISGILSSLAAGDYVGIMVLGDVTSTPDIDVIGVRFKYA